MLTIQIFFQTNCKTGKTLLSFTCLIRCNYVNTIIGLSICKLLNNNAYYFHVNKIVGSTPGFKQGPLTFWASVLTIRPNINPQMSFTSFCPLSSVY